MVDKIIVVSACLLFLIVTYGVGPQVLVEEMQKEPVKLAAFLVTLLGLWRVIVQLRTTRRIEKSKFMLSLTQGTAEFSSLMVKLGKEPSYSFEKAEDEGCARNLLRLFETTMLLIEEEETITADEIFPLMAFRTFTFMSHPSVYKMISSNSENSFARHCAAFALYDCLFRHLVRKFGKQENSLRWALWNYCNIELGDKQLDLNKKLYWLPVTAEALATYAKYTCKYNWHAKWKSWRVHRSIIKTRLQIETIHECIKKRNCKKLEAA